MKLRSLAPLALTAALALMPFMAGAQTQPAAPTSDAATAQPRHMPDAEHQLRHLTKRLNLTDAQQQQIMPILVDRDKQMAAIRNDSTLTPEQQHRNMGKLMHDSMSQVRNVLTDSQRQQWEQSRERMRERRHDKATPPVEPTQPTPPSV